MQPHDVIGKAAAGDQIQRHVAVPGSDERYAFADQSGNHVDDNITKKLRWGEQVS